MNQQGQISIPSVEAAKGGVDFSLNNVITLQQALLSLKEIVLFVCLPVGLFL